MRSFSMASSALLTALSLHLPAARDRCNLVMTDAPPAALTAALSEDRASEIWAMRPDGTLPGASSQAALIDWLRVGPLAVDPDQLLYTCLRREPRLLARASNLKPLRESHAELATLLCEDSAPKRLANAVARHPKLLLTPAATLRATAQMLASATGLSPSALRRVLRTEPSLLMCSAESVEQRLLWLEKRLGIGRDGRLQRVIQRAPLVLRLSRSKTLEPRRACLMELGVSEELLGSVVVRTPRVLHTPLAALHERADWLRQAGVLSPSAPASAFGDFLRRQPDYFGLSPKQCDAALEWLTGLGVSAQQVCERGVVVAFAWGRGGGLVGARSIRALASRCEPRRGRWPCN